MMEKYEGSILAAEAEKRLSQNVEYTSQEGMMKKLGLSDSDLNDVEVNLD